MCVYFLWKRAPLSYSVVTKARNMRLHLKGKTIRNNSALDILRTLMQQSYYDEREI